MSSDSNAVRDSSKLRNIGMLLIGVAGIIFAVSFSIKDFAQNTSPSTGNELGFEIVVDGNTQLLLDKSSGSIWGRVGANTWCYQYVEDRHSSTVSGPYANNPCKSVNR